VRQGLDIVGEFQASYFLSNQTVRVVLLVEVRDS
jgi:hypothetical protein